MFFKLEKFKQATLFLILCIDFSLKGESKDGVLPRSLHAALVTVFELH